MARRFVTATGVPPGGFGKGISRQSASGREAGAIREIEVE